MHYIINIIRPHQNLRKCRYISFDEYYIVLGFRFIKKEIIFKTTERKHEATG